MGFASGTPTKSGPVIALRVGQARTVCCASVAKMSRPVWFVPTRVPVSIRRLRVASLVHVNPIGQALIVRLCDVPTRNFSATIRWISTRLFAHPWDVIVSMMATALIAEVFGAVLTQADAIMERNASISSTDSARPACLDTTAVTVRRVILASHCSSQYLFVSFDLVACPGVKSGLCFNGGICSGGKTCLCGKRSDWAGEDCSEREWLQSWSFPSLMHGSHRFYVGKCSGSYHCLNKGTCTNSNDRACHCPPNFFGRFCENRLEHDIEPKHDQLQKHQERRWLDSLTWTMLDDVRNKSMSNNKVLTKWRCIFALFQFILFLFIEKKRSLQKEYTNDQSR